MNIKKQSYGSPGVGNAYIQQPYATIAGIQQSPDRRSMAVGGLLPIVGLQNM